MKVKVTHVSHLADELFEDVLKITEKYNTTSQDATDDRVIHLHCKTGEVVEINLDTALVKIL